MNSIADFRRSQKLVRLEVPVYRTFAKRIQGLGNEEAYSNRPKLVPEVQDTGYFTGAPADDLHPIHRLVSGDKQALVELYDRFSSLVYSLALRILGDEDSAENVLQEVFLSLWRGTEVCYQSQESFSVWLTFVTRRVAMDQLQIGKRLEPPEDLVFTYSQHSEHQYVIEVGKGRRFTGRFNSRPHSATAA